MDTTTFEDVALSLLHTDQRIGGWTEIRSDPPIKWSWVLYLTAQFVDHGDLIDILRDVIEPGSTVTFFPPRDIGKDGGSDRKPRTVQIVGDKTQQQQCLIHRVGELVQHGIELGDPNPQHPLESGAGRYHVVRVAVNSSPASIANVLRQCTKDEGDVVDLNYWHSNYCLTTVVQTPNWSEFDGAMIKSAARV